MSAGNPTVDIPAEGQPQQQNVAATNLATNAPYGDAPDAEKSDVIASPNEPSSPATTTVPHGSSVSLIPPPAEEYNMNDHGMDPTSSEEDQSFPFTNLAYIWAGGALWRGFKMNWNDVLFEQKDLLLLPRDEEAIKCYAEFKPKWEDELVRHEAEMEKDPKPDSVPNLFGVLFKTFKLSLLRGAFGRAISDACSFVSPFLLREFIFWLTDVAVSPDSRPEHEGYIWACALAVNQLLMSYSNNGSLHYTAKSFCQMKSSAAVAVFDKAGRLEVDNGLEGVAVQLHTTDATKFFEMSLFFHQMWTSPFMIIGAIIALYFFIGWAGVICIGAIAIFLPIQGMATGKIVVARRTVAEFADERLTAMSELLFGIRIVKFMGWERPLEHKIAKIRQKELDIYKGMYFWRSVMTCLIGYQPVVVSFVVFAVAYGLGEEINPANVFPTMAMLNVLRMPLLSLPLSITRLIDLKVSLGRISRFLAAPEKEIYMRNADLGENAIELKDVTCQYFEAGNPEPRPIIANINATIPKKKLTIVVGPTGCGKSTLVSAMLGESKVSAESQVTQDGTVAYVPQESWMMNATVRDNILMGKPFDDRLYVQTVKACQLMADLKQLKASDMTEIGERGINVSGGQKQRVAFARAVYSDRDIIVMDDPLSAVDAHVATALFDHCICGALDGKTRVLVTHHVQFLPRADNIIVMGDRYIKFAGTYDELVAANIDIGVTPEEEEEEAPAPAPAGDAANGDAAHPPSRQKTIEEILDKQAQDEEEIERQKTNDAMNEIPPPQDDKLMSAETSKVGGVDMTSVAWYYSSQKVWFVLLSVSLFAVWRGCGVVSDMFVSWWSTRSEVAGYSNITQDQYLQWYGIFIALQAVFLILRQIPFMIGSYNAAENIHKTMINRLMKAPTSFYDTTPAGRIMARFSKDIEMVDLVIPEGLNFCYNMIFVVLGVFALVCYASLWFIFLVVGIVVIYVLAWRYYSATNRAQKRIDSINRSPLASAITQALSGLSTIRAYGCFNLFDKLHTKAVNTASRSTCSWRATQRWLLLRVDLMSTLMIIIVALITCNIVYGGDTRAQRLDDLSVLTLAVTYTISISTAMSFLVTLLADIESAMNSVERCYEYAFDVPQEVDVVYGTGPGEKPQPPANWPTHGAVTFNNVCLRYAPDKPQVLKNVSFEIKPREKVGIVGRTGSGKSTLMLALFRMVEIESGEMFFDGINLHDVQMADVRQSLTIIPQDPMLFQGTIRSNLDPFDKATDDQVWEVLTKVGMKDRIDEDGRGLGAIVTEKGNNFSVGQRQLLCLARALLKECKILLLDEATASVDFDSDALIQRTIRTEFTNVTILTIAHRLATVIDSDKILLMDHGVRAEFEHPALLLRDSNSQLHSMVSALGPEQFGQLQEIAEEAYVKSGAAEKAAAVY